MRSFGELVLIFFCIFLLNSDAFADFSHPDLPKAGVVDSDNNGIIDSKVDYERFRGRVTDKDSTGHILKIKVENNNTKFLKSGDLVKFKINNKSEKRFCEARVKAIENFYFSVYVKDFSPCWNTEKYFPRGMQLNFTATILSQRIFEVSKFRQLLFLRKENFLKQLNNINTFLWTFDQQKLKAAATYDERINELMREKQLALDNLIQQKQESLILQTELSTKLDSLDSSLKHYKVERQEYLLDRWNMDHDSRMPVGQRPQKPKNR